MPFESLKSVLLKPCNLSPETVQSVAGSRAICRRKPCNLSPETVQSVAGSRAICLKNGAILYYKVIYSNIYYSIEYLIKRPRLYNYFIFVFLSVLQAVIYVFSSHPHRSITEKPPIQKRIGGISLNVLNS